MNLNFCIPATIAEASENSDAEVALANIFEIIDVRRTHVKMCGLPPSMGSLLKPNTHSSTLRPDRGTPASYTKGVQSCGVCG